MKCNNKLFLIAPFIISVTVIVFLLFSYGEMVENTIKLLIENESLPQRYKFDEGWGFDYTPVEHFLKVSSMFVLLFYGKNLITNKKYIVDFLLIGLYVGVYIYIIMEFWQMIGITLLPMVFLISCAMYCLVVKIKTQF